jgi:hypothetical protein
MFWRPPSHTILPRISASWLHRSQIIKEGHTCANNSDINVLHLVWNHGRLVDGGLDRWTTSACSMGCLHLDISVRSLIQSQSRRLGLEETKRNQLPRAAMPAFYSNHMSGQTTRSIRPESANLANGQCSDIDMVLLTLYSTDLDMTVQH